jgi:hypothetical protein
LSQNGNAQRAKREQTEHSECGGDAAGASQCESLAIGGRDSVPLLPFLPGSNDERGEHIMCDLESLDAATLLGSE